MSNSISYIIPAFNAGKTLSQCLDSVFLAFKSGDEVIVVNDASTDETQAILASRHCKVINILINQGAAHARNIGAFEAVNDLLVFVDADVVIKNSDVEKVKKYLNENKHVHTLTMNVDKSSISSNFYTDFKNLYMNFIISESQTSVNYVYGSFCATRKAGYVSWPESMRLTEDSLWGFKQKKLGYEIHCLKDIHVIHLKDYTFKSLIKNDFNISTYFAKSFLEFNRWNTLYTNESFGHTSKAQKFSVILLALFWPALFMNPISALAILVTQLTINASFFKFIHINRGLVFTIKSIGWYLVAYHVYLAGICYGSISYLSLKIKLPEEEVA